MADPIKHVVLLLLENHSFDQMLGCFNQVYPELEGVDPTRENLAIAQQETRETHVDPDPKHELANVLFQLESGNANFVSDYARSYPATTPQQRVQIMGYFPLNFLYALHALAAEFTICDHWFSSLPGPTWPNRFFALTGTSLGRVTMPSGIFNPNLHYYDQTTLFDRLNERNIFWKVYFHDTPQSLTLVHQWAPQNAARYQEMQAFFDDARGAEKDFPAFAFIEPRYSSSGQNDDHPPHNILAAQELIGRIFNAIRENEPLWRSTLLIVTYDEHGGFYDHISPPGATPPDGHGEEYTFDRLGVRVPAVLVSPWVGKRLEPTQFDHTSLLKYLIEKWNLGPLGARTAAANSIGCALRTADGLRANTLGGISIPPEMTALAAITIPAETSEVLNEHQEALAGFAAFLETKTADSPENKVERSNRGHRSAQDQMDVVQERIRLFLEQQKQKPI
jgi:phospholipase C